MSTHWLHFWKTPFLLCTTKSRTSPNNSITKWNCSMTSWKVHISQIFNLCLFCYVNFTTIYSENKAEAKMEEEFLRLLNFGVCSPSLSKFFQNTLYDTPILSNLYDVSFLNQIPTLRLHKELKPNPIVSPFQLFLFFLLLLSDDINRLKILPMPLAKTT